MRMAVEARFDRASRHVTFRMPHHELDRWSHDTKKEHENTTGKQC